MVDSVKFVIVYKGIFKVDGELDDIWDFVIEIVI